MMGFTFLFVTRVPLFTWTLCGFLAGYIAEGDLQCCHKTKPFFPAVRASSQVFVDLGHKEGGVLCDKGDLGILVQQFKALGAAQLVSMGRDSLTHDPF
jgi:hypothetical protein